MEDAFLWLVTGDSVNGKCAIQSITKLTFQIHFSLFGNVVKFDYLSIKFFSCIRVGSGTSSTAAVLMSPALYNKQGFKPAYRVTDHGKRHCPQTRS